MNTQIRTIKGLIGSGVLMLLAGVLPSGVLKADVIFDAESIFSSTFGTLDATTGVFNPISTGDPAVAGLGEVGGVLYGSDYESLGQLYSINQATGVFTSVGTPTGLSYYDFGSTLSMLFAIQNNTLDLYSIDPSTGAATLIGPTGLPVCGASQLSNNSNTLYFTECGDIYTVNTATATPTLVGPTGPYSALSTSGGVLYGAGSLPGTIDTIDPTTGAPTTGPAITGANTSDTAIFGIAPAPAVPEPASFLLMFGAMAALPLLRRRKA